MANYNDSRSDQMFSREPLKKRAAPIWRDLRLLVAVQLYMLGRISSDRASKLADVPHVEFLLSLGFYKVFPLQSELTELERAAHQAKIKPSEPAAVAVGESKPAPQGQPKESSANSATTDSEKKTVSSPHQQETQEKP
jgi:Uncharacterised protein family (UPF0175)